MFQNGTRSPGVAFTVKSLAITNFFTTGLPSLGISPLLSISPARNGSGKRLTSLLNHICIYSKRNKLHQIIWKRDTICIAIVFVNAGFKIFINIINNINWNS